MKKFIIQATVLVIIIITALALATSKIQLTTSTSPNPKIKEIQIGNAQVAAEIADTVEKRKLGLGGRESLASSSGMLFIFPKADKYSFWMKGVKFPLDFIWIKDAGVVDILKNAQPAQVTERDENLPIYQPITSVDMVLEVNAGFADTYAIKVGDNIKIK